MNNINFNEKLEQLTLHLMDKLRTEIKTSGLDEVLVWHYIKQVAQEAYNLGTQSAINNQ